MEKKMNAFVSVFISFMVVKLFIQQIRIRRENSVATSVL